MLEQGLSAKRIHQDLGDGSGGPQADPGAEVGAIHGEQGLAGIGADADRGAGRVPAAKNLGLRRRLHRRVRDLRDERCIAGDGGHESGVIPHIARLSPDLGLYQFISC